MAFTSHSALSIGTSGVAGGRLALAAGQLIVRDFAYAPLTGTAACAWPERVAPALAQLAPLLTHRRRPVVVALPAVAVLTKWVPTLPVAASLRAAELVRLAEQMAHLPSAEIEWAATILEPPARSPETAALLAVARGVEVSGLQTQLTVAGLTPTGFTVAGLALGWAFRHSYPEETAPVVVAAIEDDLVQLVFLEGARRQLRTVRLATLAGGVAELATELVRALALQRHQAFQAPPQALYLLEHSGAAPAARVELLARELGLRVERFDPLRRVTLAPGLDPAGVCRHPVAVATLVGLGVGQPLDLDLRPHAIRVVERQRRRWARALTVMALLALGLWLGAGAYAWKAQAANLHVRELEGRLPALRAAAAHRATEQARSELLRTELAAAQRAAEARTQWAAWLADLERQLAVVGDTWLDEMQLLPADTSSQNTATLRVAVRGRLLDRQNPQHTASPSAQARAQAVLARLATTPGVVAVDDPHFDARQPGMMKLGCTLVFRPAEPTRSPLP